MERAQRRSAVTEQKFWFKKQVYPSGSGLGYSHQTPMASPPPSPTRSETPSHQAWESHVKKDVSTNANVNGTSQRSADQSRCPSPQTANTGNLEDEYEEMTISEVINGNVSNFGSMR